jgi:hypothetical protein
MTDEAVDRIASIIPDFGGVTGFSICFERHAGSPPPPAWVDKLLLGMSRSRAALTGLSLTASGGAKAIREFMERYKNSMVKIRFGNSALPSSSILSEEFARSVVSTLTEVRPPKLKRLGLRCQGFDPGFAQILLCASSGACPKMESLSVVLDDSIDASSRLKDVGMVCSPHSPFKDFKLRWVGQEKLDVAPFFSLPWSMSLEVLSFANCRFPGADEISRFSVLPNVTQLAVRKCELGGAIGSHLEAFPTLKKVELYAADLDGREPAGPVPFLSTNDQVEALAEFLSTRPQIDDVALDIVGSPGNETFGAIETLFEKCNGSLTLHLHRLPLANVGFAYSGLKSCASLKAVVLRFARCGLVDRNYARFLEILAGNESLERFDLNLDATPDLRNFTQSLTGLLHRNRRLKALKLSRVPREAAEAILERSLSGLQENKSLQELHVTLAESTVVLSESLVNSLLAVLREHNRVFHTLGGTLRFPKGIRSAAEEILFLMKQNRHGRRSALTDPAPPPGVWPYILGSVAAHSTAQDVMYRFLKVRSAAERSRLREEEGEEEAGHEASSPKRRRRG